MVRVGYRIPYFPAFGTLQPDTYSGPVEVYFVYPDQLVFPDGTEVQTTVLHIGTGETGLGPVKGQAIAGVENTFQAVGSGRQGAFRVSNAVNIFVFRRVCAAITA